MKKFIPIFLIAIFLGIFIYSVGISSFNYELKYENLDDFKYHFVIIGKETARKNWNDIYNGAKSYADKNNVALELLINESVNDKKEIDFFDMSVNAKVDGIIINGYDSDEMISISEKALKSNIPVIFINDESVLSKRTSYIGVNNYMAGQMAVSLLSKYGVKDEKLNIGVVMEKKDTIQNNIRHESIVLAIKDKPNFIWKNTIYSFDSKIQLYNDIKNMIINNPDINAIIGTSSLHGEVIGEVLVDLNLVGKIVVIAFGDYPLTQRYIQNKVIDASINVDGTLIGINAVESLVKYCNNEFVEDVNYIPLEVIDFTKFSNAKVIGDE